jgi:polyisoprenoid-binding protein YceI
MIRIARGLAASLFLGLALAQGSTAADAPAKTAAVAASGPETYVIDRTHSYIGFQVRHFVSKVPGKFDAFTGSVVFDPKNIGAMQVAADIDAGSIDTDNDKRDGHLKSPDFFDVENNPKITFKSTGVKPIDATHAQLTGDLTMRGVTKPVTLEVELLGVQTTRGTEKRAGFEAKGRVNRKDFNINWNRALDNGGVMLSDDVDLVIQIEAVKPGEEQAKPATPPANQAPAASKG